jgi:hypothetical protein
VIGKSEDGLSLWRVGYHADPLGFTPLALYELSQRKIVKGGACRRDGKT